MAEPLLDFLTGRARAALPFLRKAAAAGVSAAAAQDVLRAFGAGFSQQKFNDLYAVLLNERNPERVARLVGESNAFPVDLHNVPPWDISHNFEYTVVPSFAKANQEDYLTVVSDVPLSPASVRALGAQLGTEGGESDIQAGILAPEDMTIVTIYRSGDIVP